MEDIQRHIQSNLLFHGRVQEAYSAVMECCTKYRIFCVSWNSFDDDAHEGADDYDADEGTDVNNDGFEDDDDGDWNDCK